MYLDVRGLVTTGIGNLIDPKEVALPLPWLKEGEPATADEISAEWDFVKSDPDGRSQRGGGSFESITSLRLKDEDVRCLGGLSGGEQRGDLETTRPICGLRRLASRCATWVAKHGVGDGARFQLP